MEERERGVKGVLTERLVVDIVATEGDGVPYDGAVDLAFGVMDCGSLASR